MDEKDRLDRRRVMDLIRTQVRESEFVLVGLGEEWAMGDDPQKQDRVFLMRGYHALARLLRGKTYFLITQNQDEAIFDSPLLDFFIAAPCAPQSRSQSGEKQWEAYLNWLSGTLGHRLCLLELGVGFSAPQLIRWPFEQCAKFHQKARLIRVHHSLAVLPEGLGDRGTAIRQNSLALLEEDCSGADEELPAWRKREMGYADGKGGNDDGNH